MGMQPMYFEIELTSILQSPSLNSSKVQVWTPPKFKFELSKFKFESLILLWSESSSLAAAATTIATQSEVTSPGDKSKSVTCSTVMYVLRRDRRDSEPCTPF